MVLFYLCWLWYYLYRLFINLQIIYRPMYICTYCYDSFFSHLLFSFPEHSLTFLDVPSCSLTFYAYLTSSLSLPCCTLLSYSCYEYSILWVWVRIQPPISWGIPMQMGLLSTKMNLWTFKRLSLCMLGPTGLIVTSTITLYKQTIT